MEQEHRRKRADPGAIEEMSEGALTLPEDAELVSSAEILKSKRKTSDALDDTAAKSASANPAGTFQFSGLKSFPLNRRWVTLRRYFEGGTGRQ